MGVQPVHVGSGGGGVGTNSASMASPTDSSRLSSPACTCPHMACQATAIWTATSHALQPADNKAMKVRHAHSKHHC